MAANTTGTKLYLFEQRDASEAQYSTLNYKIGGKIGDRIYVKLSNPVTNSLDVYEAEIDPSGIEEHDITNVDTASNAFTTAGTNEFETATPIKFTVAQVIYHWYESNRLYYAIKVNNTSFKLRLRKKMLDLVRIPLILLLIIVL